MTFQVQIIDYTTYEPVKTFNCKTEKQAEQLEEGLNIKLAHNYYFTKIVYLKEGKETK